MAESYCLGSNLEATFFFVFFFPLIVHKTRFSLGHFIQRSSRAKGLKFYTATQEVIRNRKQHLSEYKIFSTGRDTSFKVLQGISGYLRYKDRYFQVIISNYVITLITLITFITFITTRLRFVDLVPINFKDLFKIISNFFPA